MSKDALLWPEMGVENRNLAPAPVLDALTSLSSIKSDKDVLERLKKVNWAFANDQTNYLSHDLHPYPAKFIPQIAANLVSSLSLPGELVWDPFGGSGTTAFEALRLGRRCVSTDANPVATEIATAKCLTLTREELATLREFADGVGDLAGQPANLRSILGRNREKLGTVIPPIPNINKWFCNQVQHELAFCMMQIQDRLESAARQFARVCLSAIVIRTSFQDSETRYACKPRAVPTGEVLRFFSKQIHSALRKHRTLQHTLRFRRGDFATVNLLATDPKMPLRWPAPQIPIQLL